MASSNRRLGELVGCPNAIRPALISFGSGLLIIVVIAIFHSGIKLGANKILAAVRSGAISRWSLIGGALGGVIIAVQTQIVPLIGVAIYSVTFIAGQTVMSLLIDRIGLTGGGKRMISLRRVAAASLTVLAVAVSVWDRIDAKNLSVLALILGVIAGGIVGIQRALNGQVNEHSQQSFTTSLLNFVTGTALLLFLLLVGLVSHHAHLSRFSPGPWWMYLGGVVGVIYIAFSSTVVQHVGVHVGSYLITGILMTYLGVVANNDRSFGRNRAGRIANY